MDAVVYKKGTLVWAKLKGFPPWPAKIVQPKASTSKPKSKDIYYVYFFGSKNFAWIPKKDINPHSESFFNSLSNKKSKLYQKAVDELKNEVVKPSKSGLIVSKIKVEMESESETEEERKITDSSPHKSVKIAPSKSKIKTESDNFSSEKSPKSKPKKKGNVSIEKSPKQKQMEKGNISNIKSPKPKQKEKDISSIKSPKPKQKEKDNISSTKSPKLKQKGKGNVLSKKSPKPKEKGNALSEKSPKPKQEKKGTRLVKVLYGTKRRGIKMSTAKPSRKRVNPKCVSINEEINAPSTSYATELCGNSSASGSDSVYCDQSSDSDDSSNSSVLCIGLIGIEDLTSAIVGKLLESNFKITLWAEELRVPQQVLDLGAFLADTPASVVAESDIIFCHYTDENWFNNIMFEENGILHGFGNSHKFDSASKGLVLLSAVEKTTALQIREAISLQNGLFLEAPICGTPTQISEGKLVVQASGDRRLFVECMDIFKVIAIEYDFVSCEIGYASKLGVITNMLDAGIHGVLGETAKLADKLGVDLFHMQSVMKEAFDHTLVEKLLQLGNPHFKRVITPLKHAQKDLNLVLKLSEDHAVPMPITASTNELFKRGMQMNYSDADVSSIYKVVKF